MQYFKHCAMHNTFQQSKYFMCGNYIVQAEKHTALPNQRYLWPSGLRRWIFFIFSPITNKTIGLKLL